MTKTSVINKVIIDFYNQKKMEYDIIDKCMSSEEAMRFSKVFEDYAKASIKKRVDRVGLNKKENEIFIALDNGINFVSTSKDEIVYEPFDPSNDKVVCFPTYAEAEKWTKNLLN